MTWPLANEVVAVDALGVAFDAHRAMRKSAASLVFLAASHMASEAHS